LFQFFDVVGLVTGRLKSIASTVLLAHRDSTVAAMLSTARNTIVLQCFDAVGG